MKSKLESARRATDDALWAARNTEESALYARYMKTREALEEARSAAVDARYYARLAEEAALNDLDAEEADEYPEVFEAHVSAMAAAELARKAAEEADSSARGEATTSIAAEHIAKEKLGIDTLEQRFSDGLDFHEVSVWRLREALEAAFRAGREDGIRKR